MEVREGDGSYFVEGELDLATADAFRNTVAGTVDGSKEVVLDLSGLTFMDSRGFKAMVQLAQTVCKQGLVLRSPRENVLRILDLLKAEDIPGIRIERR